MRILPLIVLLLLLPCPGTLAEESWEQVHGGPDDDYGRCIRTTSDGGYIITGAWSITNRDRQILLLKTDAQGNQEWRELFGDEWSDIGTHVEQTSDNGYIVTGVWRIGGNFNGDVLLLKTDDQGQQEWIRLFDIGDSDLGYAVKQTTDGGYIITGYIDTGYEGSYYDLLLLKTDADGFEEWRQIYATHWYDQGNSVQQTSDGGYVIAGVNGENYEDDIWLIKTDAAGEMQWDKEFSIGEENTATEVIQLPDDGYLLACTSDPAGDGYTNAWLIRTNAKGIEEWSRPYGSAGSENGYDVQQTADGGFILTGRTPDDGGLGDLWLVKTDFSGGVQWHKTLGGAASEQGYSVRQTDDGGFVACGTTKANVVAEPDIYIAYYRPDQIPPTALVAGPGAGPDNPPLVKVFIPDDFPIDLAEFSAYGATGYGVNVACGELTGDEIDEILTGPGPGTIYGPHVRGFSMDGVPLPGLSFLAYGTNKYGVNVTAGDLDNDGYDEIITGAGPGAVFGPHVRAFDYDGGPTVTPLPTVNFFAYGTQKWGANVASGDIDGDGYDEIVTGAGPGSVFGPHVRGWDVDGGTASAISGLSFFAYGTEKFGVNISCGDLDGDGIAELVTAPGPGPLLTPHIRGWNFDGDQLTPLPNFNFIIYGPAGWHFGASVDARIDLDGNGRTDLVVGPGPDPDIPGWIYLYGYDGQQMNFRLFYDNIFPDLGYGTRVASGRY